MKLLRALVLKPQPKCLSPPQSPANSIPLSSQETYVADKAFGSICLLAVKIKNLNPNTKIKV